MFEKIVNDFLAHMRQCGGSWQNWYVGIAEDPKARLFTDHNVSKDGDSWIHSAHAGTDTVARNVEQYFLSYGCVGGPGGGSSRSCFVYAYKVAPHTNENN